MVANSLISSLNLDIEVKLLWHKDGTTTASALFFLFHEMHFNDHQELGTKEALPFVTQTEQQCISNHVFSYVFGKRLVLVKLEDFAIHLVEAFFNRKVSSASISPNLLGFLVNVILVAQPPQTTLELVSYSIIDDVCILQVLDSMTSWHLQSFFK